MPTASSTGTSRPCTPPRTTRTWSTTTTPPTGAAKAAEKALPELRGRLTGNAVRVPTPNVSLAVLHLTLGRPVGRDELNGVLRESSLTSVLRRQIDYVESPEIVSTDLLGSRRAGIVDGLATIADGSEHVVLYVWYDNESGYSRQVHRVLQEMARAAHRPRTEGEAAPGRPLSAVGRSR